MIPMPVRRSAAESAAEIAASRSEAEDRPSLSSGCAAYTRIDLRVVLADTMCNLA